MTKGFACPGRFNARGRGRQAAASLTRENAWSPVDRGTRFRARRVVVKARVVKLNASKSHAVDSHLRYLQRDGVTGDGERGQVYAAFTNSADAQEFPQRGWGDKCRHLRNSRMSAAEFISALGHQRLHKFATAMQQHLSEM